MVSIRIFLAAYVFFFFFYMLARRLGQVKTGTSLWRWWGMYEKGILRSPQKTGLPQNDRYYTVTSRRQSRFASSPSPAMATIHSMSLTPTYPYGEKTKTRNQWRQVLSGVRGGDSSVAANNATPSELQVVRFKNKGLFRGSAQNRQFQWTATALYNIILM